MDGDSDQDRRPVPDPTILTTEQLLREVAALRREIGVEINALRRETNQELKLRRSLTDQKFVTVNTELQLIERQRVEQKSDSRAALDAALAAAKEAVDKNEKATAEQLKQQDAKFGTEITALKGNHDDLKERVAKIESMGLGGQQKVADLRATLIIGLTLATLVLGVIVFLANQMTKGG